MGVDLGDDVGGDAIGTVVVLASLVHGDDRPILIRPRIRVQILCACMCVRLCLCER